MSLTFQNIKYCVHCSYWHGASTSSSSPTTPFRSGSEEPTEYIKKLAFPSQFYPEEGSGNLYWKFGKTFQRQAVLKPSYRTSNRVLILQTTATKIDHSTAVLVRVFCRWKYSPDTRISLYRANLRKLPVLLKNIHQLCIQQIKVVCDGRKNWSRHPIRRKTNFSLMSHNCSWCEEL
jgi:hypothetical protein